MMLLHTLAGRESVSLCEYEKYGRGFYCFAGKGRKMENIRLPDHPAAQEEYLHLLATCDSIDREIREVTEIMVTGIARGDITGWRPLRTSRRFGEYGTQRGWERTDDRGQESEQISFSLPPSVSPASGES